MILHIFAVASVFVGLSLGAPGGEVVVEPKGGVPHKLRGPAPHKRWGWYDWSSGTETLTINAGGSSEITSAWMKVNQVSNKIVQTSTGYNLDIECKNYNYDSRAFTLNIYWTGGSAKYDQSSGDFKQSVPANRAVLRMTAGSAGYQWLLCTIKSVAASTATTTKAPGGGSCSVATKTSCQCGKQTATSRIVGGTNAVLGEAPWQVGLVFKLNSGGYYPPFCGGTIVSAYHIITAAHCTTMDDSTGNYGVTYGTLNRMSTAIIDVAKVYDHPNYNAQTVANDITVMKLATAMPFSATVIPACLPDPSLDYAGKNALMSGWGRIGYESDSQQPETLQKVVMQVETHDTCNAAWQNALNKDLQVCTVGNKVKGTFKGDSGGPMVVQNQGSYELVGVVSFGNKCSNCGVPVVFTRVTGYLTWINKIICETSSDYFCSKPTLVG